MNGAGEESRRRSTIRSILVVATGTLAAQLLNVAFSPIITRLFTPEQFGIQGLFVSILSVIAPVVTLSLPLAIVVAKSQSEELALHRVTRTLSFIIAGAMIVALVGGQHQINGLFKLPADSLVLFLLPLGVVLTADQLSWEYRAVRHEQFRASSVASFGQALATNIAKVGLGLVMPSAFTLSAANAVSPGFKALLMSLNYRKQVKVAPEDRDASKRMTVTDLVKRRRDFVLFRTPNDVISAASHALPVILLALLFTPAIAGFYTLARSVLNLPAQVLAKSVGDVLYFRFAQLHRAHSSMVRLLSKSTLGLLAISSVLLGLFALVAPPMFAFVFGKEWREAGVVGIWMSLWIVFYLANVPASKAAVVIRKQNAMLILSIFNFVLRGLSLILPASYGLDAVSVVAIFSITCAAGYVLVILVVAVLTRREDSRNMGGERQDDEMPLE